MRALLLAVVLAGCTDVCHSQVSNQATTQRTAFEAEIAACTNQNNCVPLCTDVFQIHATDVADCEIQKSDLSTVTVRVIVNDAARCEAGATDLYLGWGDDDGYEDDDGCDDGSCDDGSTDDGGDDGSTDDGGDDGGDSGDSGDDGGDGTDDATPHLPAGSAVHYTLAPQR